MSDGPEHSIWRPFEREVANFALYGALFGFLFPICATFIDFDTQLLPDQLTLPLVWLGLLINLNGHGCLSAGTLIVAHLVSV